jgi:hypothetical protein
MGSNSKRKYFEGDHIVFSEAVRCLNEVFRIDFSANLSGSSFPSSLIFRLIKRRPGGDVVFKKDHRINKPVKVGDK